jgi:trehalose 6-phosphate phosphatase
VPLPSSTVRDLPDALHDEGMLAQRMAGRRPEVFLDYDGVLTPPPRWSSS